jgi:hypothetical protein
VPKGEEKAAKTGRLSPETAPTPERFRSAEPKDEITISAEAAHKQLIDKAFGYFAVRDMIVGFTPGN